MGGRAAWPPSIGGVAAVTDASEEGMDNAPYRFTLIKAGRLIDGTGAPPIERGAVLFDNGKIAAAGPESEVAAPDGARVLTIEYPRMTVMPGMVDAHTHNNGFGDGRAGDDLATLPDEVLTVNSARNARLSLFTGVTTVRENGPKNTTMFRLRDAVEEGITVAPRLVLCGRAVSIIGGHMSYFGIESTGPVEARMHVRQLIKEGADYIKITATGGSTRTSFPLRPSFEVDELRAMTGEAHKFGKLTAAHCLSTQGIANALDAGVDMIIHCVFKEQDDSDVFRYDVAERIGEQGAYVNPTLHVGRSGNWVLEHKKADRGLTRAEQVTLDEGYRSLDRRLEDCRRMIEMGLKVITGSDSSWGNYQLGNTPYEAECLVMAGYSPMQALLSVTRDSAASIGMGDRVGTLEPGKEADVIVVDGNPAEDINALWNVADVFFAGQRVDRGSVQSRSGIRQQPPLVSATAHDRPSDGL